MSKDRTVTVGPHVCGAGRTLMVIAGPCVIESHDLTLRIADTILSSRVNRGRAASTTKRSSCTARRRITSRTFGASTRPPDPSGRRGRVDRLCIQ